MSETMKYGRPLGEVLREEVTFRGKTGEGKYESFLATKQINNHFKGHPLYVGAIRYGSTQLGYSVPSSDIDIVVLADLSRCREVTRKLSKKDRFSLAVFDFCQGLKFSKHVESRVLFLDPDAISDIVERIVESGVHDRYIKGWHILFNPTAIGPRIDEFRMLVAEEIKKRPQNQQNAAISAFAQAAVTDEAKRASKMKERITDVNTSDLFESFSPFVRENTNRELSGQKTRVMVWEEQIRQVLGLKK